MRFEERQTMLFSATMPPEIMKIASGHMKLPVAWKSPLPHDAERVTQEFSWCVKKRRTALWKTAHPVSDHDFDFHPHKIRRKRLPARSATWIHRANSTPIFSRSARKRLMIKTGKYRVLVATDIAARASTSPASSRP